MKTVVLPVFLWVVLVCCCTKLFLILYLFVRGHKFHSGFREQCFKSIICYYYCYYHHFVLRVFTWTCARGTIHRTAPLSPRVSWSRWFAWLRPGLDWSWGKCPQRRTQRRWWRLWSTGTASDRTRHFTNRCDIYSAVKVVRRNRSDNHCNQSDAWLSILLLELY